MSESRGLRDLVGCWLNERWRTELALRKTEPADGCWLDLCNRSERLSRDAATGGRYCHWRDSSELTVSRVFPETGPRLLAKCLAEHPVHLEFGARALPSDLPGASVLIAIGGADRLPQFEIALASLRGQDHGDYEIVVVEQGAPSGLEDLLPPDVGYHWTPPQEDGFNKSWALNVAARAARGRHLLIQDGDYVVGRDYVSSCVAALERVEALRPGRLIFKLDRDSTREVMAGRALLDAPGLEGIVQNNPTPLAVRAETYRRIGGHDESFFGWGGEDVEFLDRLRTASISEGGFLPLLHLWHPSAPKKRSGDRNRERHLARLGVPAPERIIALEKLDWGRPGEPCWAS